MCGLRLWLRGTKCGGSVPASSQGQIGWQARPICRESRAWFALAVRPCPVVPRGYWEHQKTETFFHRSFLIARGAP